MHNFYHLSFSKNALPFVSQFYQASNNALYGFYNNKLYNYQYKNGTWQALHIADIHAQCLYFTNISNRNILIAKTKKGIVFYECQHNSLKLLSRDSNDYGSGFCNWDEPGNNIKFGHFYSNTSLFGMLAEHKEHETKCCAVIELRANEYLIQPFYTDLNILNNSSKTKLFLAELKRKGQDNIITYSKKGLNIYKFNYHDRLEHLMQVPHCAKSDDSEEKLFFPNLTGQSYQDIVLLNSSGLFVYQYSNEQNNYKLIHYNPRFTKLKGWNVEHINSIQFEDIDLDGRQDMLFTGPQGINLLSFDNYTNQWRHLLDNSQLTATERHSNIVEVIPASPPIIEFPTVFAEYKNQLHWANIIEVEESFEEEIEPQIVDRTLPKPAPPVIPRLLKPEGERPVILLRDELDCSSIVDAVDKNTGKPKIKLPLVDLSNLGSEIKLDFIYDGNNKMSDILGLGWSLPQDFIALSHQASIFPEDEKYYIISKDLPQQLIFDSNNSTDTVLSFKLSNDQSALQIYYHKDKENWQIKNENIEQIYGLIDSKNTHPVKQELTWKNWRGVGSSTTGQKQLATGWYLSKVKDKNGNVMHYMYNSVNISIPGGKNFTQGIYLAKVSDSQGNRVFFTYSDKLTSRPLLVDKEGNFNTQVVQTRCLKRYKVITPSYQQVIKFVYEIKGKKRFLTKICQKGEIANRPILQFSYESESGVLEKVTLPTDASIKFHYELLDIDERKEKCDVRGNYRVDYSNNSILVSYLHGRVLRLKSFDKKREEEFDTSSETVWKMGGFDTLSWNIWRTGGVARSHSILYVKDSLAAILDYGDSKEICIFYKRWSWRDPRCSDKGTVVARFGRDFIVIAGAGYEGDSFKRYSIKIHNWNKYSQSWTEKILSAESVKDPLLAASNRMLLLYSNDLHLSIWYRDHNNEWQSKVIKAIPGIVSDIKETLDKFDLDSELHKQLLNYFKDIALQLNNNLLLLNRWKLEGTRLYSIIDSFILNSRYEIVQEQQYKVAQDNLSEFLREIKYEGKFLTLGYKSVNDKFEIIVKDFRGSLPNRVSRNCRWSYAKDACIDAYRDVWKKHLTKNFIKSLKGEKPFLLNYQSYIAIFSNSQTIVCNNRKFTFTGNKWNETIISEAELKQERLSISLGNEFILSKENAQSSFKLYSQGNILLDLKVKQLNSILIRYPVYLAYQEDNTQAGVIEFSNEGSIKRNYTLPKEEKLSFWSNYRTLVTSIINAKNGTTLVFRSHLDLRPNSVIKKVTIDFDDGSKRITGYEYSGAKSLGNTVYYEKTSLIPGCNKTSFGWIEESRLERKVFNSKGELVKTIKFKEEQINANDTIINEENLYLSTTLLDKTGRLEVAQFFPYEIKDEEVGYYSFEDYEVNRIGIESSMPEKKWLFDETDVVKRNFSFTGKNYLSLSGKILVGTFQPNNQNQEYVASCWIRPQSEMFKIGGITPYLKAVVSTEDGNEVFGLLSKVQFQSGNWFYLEVVIDLLFAKQVYKGLSDAQSDEASDRADVKLKASIFIGTGANTTIDVDHVRFSPLNNDFQANVYDLKTKRMTEIISVNGLVKRYVYDKYQEQVASINEYGQLEKFNTYTKTSSIGKIMQLGSNIRIQPESGFYEDFSPYSFYKRWKIDNASVWQISPGQLRHSASTLHNLQLNLHNINPVSYGIRLCFSMQSERSHIDFFRNLKITRTMGEAYIMFSDKKQSIPLSGEMLVIIENSRLFVWIDGNLYIDDLLSNSLFDLRIGGKVTVNNVIIFSEPSVQVDYFNALGEKLQEIILENENTAIITEYLYDELGRQTITTKPARIERISNRSLLAHYPDFVTNSDPYSVNSVWKIGELQGKVSEIVGKYGYSQIKYENNLLNEKSAIGLPGKEFSVSGLNAKRFASLSENLFINTLFPSSKNYRYQVELKPRDAEDISVFDDKGNMVAWYSYVQRGKDLLSTYEYDENDRLVKILPPLYHQNVGTLYKQVQFLSEEEDRTLQHSLGTYINYDEKGNIIAKKTPDSGKEEYLYDNNGLLKFVLHYSNFNDKGIKSVIYFNHDQQGRLIETGKLDPPLPKENLLTLALTSNNTQVYQQFYHSDFEREPILRGKLKRTVTFNDGEPFIEESVLDVNKEIISKRIITLVENSDPLFVAINKKYVAGKLREIEYPIDIQDQPFKLTYQHNKLDKVTGIDMSGKQIVKFTYNAAGQMINEQHLPGSAKSFTRQYSYNPAGFLTHLEDKFLTEEVQYGTDGSYGSYEFGNGDVTRTTFKATWHKYCNDNKLGLNEQSFVSKNITLEESVLCFHKLKQAGYLNEVNRQAKVYYPSLELELPLVCSYEIRGYQVRNTLGKKGFPAEYGYSYDYGNHQELTKAKYFVGNEVPTPLQPGTFAREIPGINDTASHDIWRILRDSGYLIENNEKVDLSLGYGKKGKSFILPGLFYEPRNFDTGCWMHELTLERLLGNYFFLKQSVSKSDLQGAFAKWFSNVRDEKTQQDISKIIEFLERNYLQNPFTKKFNDSLSRYKSFIPDIARILSEHFAKQLGEAEFDIKSYDIDANGNHENYHTGFDYYRLSYHNNTNQINSIKFESCASSKPKQNFTIQHDSRGNVIQALHKGIEKIDYNPVSNRATKIQLNDGKTLTFYYDAQGERVLKRVANGQGQITKEIHYIRDGFGHALVERQITYISPDLPPDILVTGYIYGPRELLGFIRYGEFYSVITDHEGSIRLVVKGGEVVAAYDYLPYGNLMREYGSNPEAHISYRYTGQEWDEEIGLYNYHARFYDPSIGRFYQVDPKGQYFSPYKYAGNSPVSVVDPDGEFAFLITAIILGITGAYLGGAAANNDWNPGKWEWKSGKTWIGMIDGGIGGALLPVGFVGSAGLIGYSGTIALGTGGAYLGAAAANNDWDPGKWDFSSPITWSGGFQGFGVGSGAVGGFSYAKTFYQSLSSSLGKGAFIVGSASTGTGLFVMNGFAANWDFSKPRVYYGLVDAVTSAPDLPMFMRSAGRSFAKRGKQIMKGVRGNQFKSASLATGKMVAKMARMGAGVSSYVLLSMLDNGRLNTDIFDISTVLTGMLTENQLFSMSKNAYRTYKLRKKANVEEKSEAIRKAEMISREAADNTVAEYKRAIESVKQEAERAADTSSNGKADDSSKDTESIMRVFDPNKKGSELPYNSGVRMALKEGRIPNAAVGVVTTNNFAVVAFSTSNAPGFISVYSHDKLNHLIYLHGKLQDSNSVIAQREVTLSSNAELNQRLMNDIENVKRVIIADNMKKFDDRITKGSLSRLLDTLPNDVKNNIIEELKRVIGKNGWIHQNKIDKIVKEFLINKNPVIKKMSGELKELEKELSRKSNRMGSRKIDQERKDRFQLEMDKIKNKQKKLDTTLQEKKREMEISKTEITEKFWEQVKDFYGGLLADRSPANCAEPHAITALSRMNEIAPRESIAVSSKGNEYGIALSIRTDDRTPLTSRSVNSYDRSEDIRFLATYKLTDQNSLESFPRCDYCLITTKHIKHVVTDPLYQEILRNFGKLEHSKKKLYFLIPYNDMISRLHYISARGEDDVSNRTRRSVFSEQAEMEDEFKYRDNVSNSNSTPGRHIDISKKVTNSGARPFFLINGFFNWVTAKVKSLIELAYNNALPVGSPIQALQKENAPTKSVSNKGWSSSWGKVKGAQNSGFALSKGTSSTASSISQVYAQPDTTGLMLLAPVLMNTMGRKFVFPLLSADQPIPLLEAHGHALNIKEGFEKAVKQAASKSGISMHRLNIDFVEVEKEIAGKIIGGKFGEIPGILNSYVEKAFPDRKAGYLGRLSPKKFDKFMTIINNKLDILLIPQILSKKQQGSLNPRGYLDNILTQPFDSNRRLR